MVQTICNVKIAKRRTLYFETICNIRMIKDKVCNVQATGNEKSARARLCCLQAICIGKMSEFRILHGLSSMQFEKSKMAILQSQMQCKNRRSRNP